MRIAILGAGLSGLSCAHELERLGFAPEIFEKRHRVGERFINAELMLQMMHIHPSQDIFDHVRQDLKLPLNPECPITRAVLHGPNHEAMIQGRLGYLTLRGHDDRALERQLERHIHAPIQFNANPDVRELRQEYDWVVVATGDHAWSQELNQWQPDIAWWMRGAVIKGDFAPGEIHFFFNTRYCKTGYGVLSAWDENTASIGIGVPHSTPDEVDQYWDVLRSEMGHLWRSEERQFKLEKYECGMARTTVVGNVMLIGAAGGFVDSVGITGQCPSMGSGIYAARQIALQDRSLERHTRQWHAYYRHNWRIRRNVNAWTDDDMDRLVQVVKAGGGYLATRSPWSLIRPGGMMLDLFRAADDLSPETGFM